MGNRMKQQVTTVLRPAVTYLQIIPLSKTGNPEYQKNRQEKYRLSHGLEVLPAAGNPAED